MKKVLFVRWFNGANEELARVRVLDVQDATEQLIAMIIDSGIPLQIGDNFRFDYAKPDNAKR
jgi:hypothetical protein